MPPRAKPTSGSTAGGSSSTAASRKPTKPAPQPIPDISSPPSPTPSTASTEISAPLISRILHEFLATSTTNSSSQTRISNAAVSAVAHYTKTFVQEAIHRAAVVRRKEEAENGMGNSNVVPQVEVNDLEKVGPQLILDF